MVLADRGHAAGFNVRTTVHEYGGGAYAVQAGVIFFSTTSPTSGCIGRTRAPSRSRSPPRPMARHRFADGRSPTTVRGGSAFANDTREWRAVAEVVNELVAVPDRRVREARVIASGRDFYADPRISPDGSLLSFLAWDLPWMPWDGCELFVARPRDDGRPRTSASRRRQGRRGIDLGARVEPVGRPVFASDRSGWWNLERLQRWRTPGAVPDGGRVRVPAVGVRRSSFGFLSTVASCAGTSDMGVQSLAVLDPETGELLDLDLPHSALDFGPQLVGRRATIAFIAGAPDLPDQLVWLDFSSRSVEVIRESAAGAGRRGASSRRRDRSSSPPTAIGRRSPTSIRRPAPITRRPATPGLR